MARVDWSLVVATFLFMSSCSCTALSWGRKTASPALPINHNVQPGWESGFSNHTSNSSSSGSRAGPDAVRVACGLTTYKAMCERTLMNYTGAESATPPELVVISLRLALDAVQQAYGLAYKLVHNASSSSASAIRDCMQLMDDSRDQLSLSIAILLPLTPSQRERRANVEEEIEDALFSTSAALTYQSTCIDGLKEHKQIGPVASAMSEPITNICAPLVTIALQLVAHLGNHLCSWQDHHSQNGPPFHAEYPAC